jgi:hypothetical protein
MLTSPFVFVVLVTRLSEHSVITETAGCYAHMYLAARKVADLRESEPHARPVIVKHLLQGTFGNLEETQHASHN